MKKIVIVILIINFLVHFYKPASATHTPINSTSNYYSQVYAESYLKNFKTRTFLTVPKVDVPTVFRYKISDAYEKKMLVEVNSGIVQPYVEQSETEKTKAVISSNKKTNQDEQVLMDDDFLAVVKYPLESERLISSVIFEIDYLEPIETSLFNIQLAQFGDLPKTIQISANIPQNIIVATRNMHDYSVYFPTYRASKWYVTLTYEQPLNLTEINFSEANQKSKQYLYFLAVPNATYMLYTNPDNANNIPYVEPGTFAADKNAKTIEGVLEQNPYYTPSDQDVDGIVDSIDNCPNLSNKNQVDKNGNRVGDDCEDFDYDGIMNSNDNCLQNPNRTQIDTDGDKVGDHCDSEESRLSEQFAILPWLGLGMGFIVVLGIFSLTLKRKSGDSLDTQSHKSSGSNTP